MIGTIVCEPEPDHDGRVGRVVFWLSQNAAECPKHQHGVGALANSDTRRLANANPVTWDRQTEVGCGISIGHALEVLATLQFNVRSELGPNRKRQCRQQTHCCADAEYSRGGPWGDDLAKNDRRFTSFPDMAFKRLRLPSQNLLAFLADGKPVALSARTEPDIRGSRIGLDGRRHFKGNLGDRRIAFRELFRVQLCGLFLPAGHAEPISGPVFAPCLQLLVQYWQPRIVDRKRVSLRHPARAAIKNELAVGLIGEK